MNDKSKAIQKKKAIKLIKALKLKAMKDKQKLKKDKIKQEKAKLIKEKKVRKEKLLPQIKEDEIPFELPEGF